MTEQPAAAEAFEPEESHVDLDVLYPWVRAWSQLIGLSPEQTSSMQKRAYAEQAPPIALIRASDAERWVLLTDVWSNAYETRLWLLDWAWSRNLSIPYEVLRVWLDPLSDPPSVMLAREEV